MFFMRRQAVLSEPLHFDPAPAPVIMVVGGSNSCSALSFPLQTIVARNQPYVTAFIFSDFSFPCHQNKFSFQILTVKIDAGFLITLVCFTDQMVRNLLGWCVRSCPLSPAPVQNCCGKNYSEKRATPAL